MTGPLTMSTLPLPRTHDAHAPRRPVVPLTTLLLSLAVGATPALAQAPATVDAPSTTRPHVEHLASPALEGRATGSPGADRAAAYIEAQLEAMGARPLPGRSDYRLPFEYTAGMTDGGTTIEVTRNGETAQFATADAVQALSFSDSSEVSGPVVFAGYGLTVPDAQGFSYDSYATLDVKDKIVLVLRYFPEDADDAVRATLARYSGLRYKALMARERGAKGLLVVTGPRSPNAGTTVPLAFDTANAGSGIAAASISGDVATRLFAGRAQSLADAQQALDSANPHVVGFALDGVTVRLHTKVSRETRTTHNVVGVLPATARIALPRPHVVIGAHYDHLGRGNRGSSLARQEDADKPHLGADDNASGVAAVLEAARLLARGQRQRAVVVAFWSGEEMGLLGSSAFVAAPPVPATEISAYVNLDMVGRMRDNTLTAQAVGSSPIWRRLLEQANVTAGFNLQLQDDPYLPTDSAAFNQADLPTLSLFTGGHEDYHRPSDSAEKVQYEDLDRVAAFAADIVRRLAAQQDAPAFTKVTPRAPAGGGRDTVRAFTGTIPEYATKVEGLLLSGVVSGGPAEEAGLAKGDVIVQFGSRTITNIYDYTYALDTAKAGVPITVVYLRNGERRETTLTPRARR
jgi:Zn-dependent M28 family amino/carboxypeptidase